MVLSTPWSSISFSPMGPLHAPKMPSGMPWLYASLRWMEMEIILAFDTNLMFPRPKWWQISLGHPHLQKPLQKFRMICSWRGASPCFAQTALWYYKQFTKAPSTSIKPNSDYNVWHWLYLQCGHFLWERLNQLLNLLMQAIQSGTPCTSTHEPPGGIVSGQTKQAIKH